MVKEETPETQVQSLVWKDPLEEGRATHSWRILRTEEPFRTQSTGWQSQTRMSDLTRTQMHPIGLQNFLSKLPKGLFTAGTVEEEKNYKSN